MSNRAGGHLPDAQMRKYDHKSGTYLDIDWSKKDKPLSLIKQGLIQRAGASSPGTEHIIRELTPISNQGPVNDCVANAWCDMMEILEGIDTGKVEQLSRLFLYWTSRYYTGDTDKDDGTYLRSAATQLNKIGIIDEKWIPYTGSTDVVYKSPELDLYTMASNNRLAGFYKPESLNPDGLLSELELAVRADHPFVFGVDVNGAFEAYGGGGAVFTRPDSDIKGSHAMICVGVGYDGSKRWWLWRNSWGSGWGDGGHVKVDDDYLLSIGDIWIGTKMSELV